MKKSAKIVCISVISLFLSANAQGGHETAEARAAKKVEKEILKDLKKDVKELAKTLAKGEEKDLKKSFKYFKKLEKHNDEFIADYDEAVSRFSLFSSEAQKQILIDGFCTDKPELTICIPEYTFEYVVGEAGYHSYACIETYGNYYAVYMLPEPSQLTFYVDGEIKFVQQESYFMDNLFYGYNYTSWYGFGGSGLSMEIGQTVSNIYGDEYGHLTLVSAAQDSIELRLDILLQYTDPNTGEIHPVELSYDLDYVLDARWGGYWGGFGGSCGEEEGEWEE